MFAPLHISDSKTHATPAQDTSVPFFQPKLTVNTPGDAHEQQADQVADQVMRMREGDKPIVQRMSMTPASRIMRKCAECEKEDVQRKESSGSDAGGKAAPSVVSEVISSGGGQPIDGSTRQFMESRFGQDFSQVRIHTDSRAIQSADAIQAKAYTSGKDIVFGKGAYQPQSEGGKRLLAHELAHVGQQRQSHTGSVQRATDGSIWAAVKRGVNQGISDAGAVPQAFPNIPKDTDKKCQKAAGPAIASPAARCIYLTCMLLAYQKACAEREVKGDPCTEDEWSSIRGYQAEQELICSLGTDS